MQRYARVASTTTRAGSKRPRHQGTEFAMTATIATTAIPAGTWTVDPAHSKVGFAVKPMGIATVRGELTEFEGTLQIADDLSSAKAYGTVKAPRSTPKSPSATRTCARPTSSTPTPRGPRLRVHPHRGDRRGHLPHRRQPHPARRHQRARADPRDQRRRRRRLR